MTQITIEGSTTTPTTFLKAGARITVERTSYIDKLIGRGYVNVVQVHEPIHESTPAIMNEIEQEVDGQREAAAAEHALTGAPARNGLTEDWRNYLTERGFSGLETATRAEMIAAWEEDQARRGQSVD